MASTPVTNRFGVIALDFLLLVFLAIAALSIFDELGRQHDDVARKMEKQRQVNAKATKWTALDEAGRRMTGYDLIGKK